MHFTPSWGFCQKHHGRRLRRQSDLFRVRGLRAVTGGWMRVAANLRWQNSCLWKWTPIQNKPYIILLQFDTMLDVDVYVSYACVLLCNLRLRRHFSWYFYYTIVAAKISLDDYFLCQCFDFPGADFLPQKHSRADHSGPVSLAENLGRLSLHWFSHVWEQSMTKSGGASKAIQQTTLV